MADKQKDRVEDVDEACRALRKAHADGTELLETFGEWAKHGDRAIDKEAKKRRINADLLRKLRQFANPEGGYTPDELNRLVKLCREERRALGVTFVYKLVTVPKENGQREEFEREVIANRWSLARVGAELRERFGARRRGGRRRAVPGKHGSLLAQIDEMCASWERWHVQLNTEIADNGDGENGKRPVDELSRSTRVKLKIATDAINQLRLTAQRSSERTRGRS